MSIVPANTCESGSFGQNCQFECHCAEGSTCSEGECSNGCADQWEGHKCQISKIEYTIIKIEIYCNFL